MIKANSLFKLAVLAGMVMFLFSSCDLSEKYEKQEREEISDFLSRNDTLDFELKASGLYYLDIAVGAGEFATTHDTSYIMLSVYDLDGTEIGTNFGTTDTLVRPVNEGYLLSGIEEGLTYMREGGKAKMLLPSKLAYGAAGYYDGYIYIPGYTPLIYNIYLARLEQGPGK